MAVTFRPFSQNLVQTGTKVLSTTAEALGSGSYDGITIQAAPTNLENVAIGGEESQDFVLTPGSGHSFSNIDLANIYAKKLGAGAASVNWIYQDEP
jgi:hypothetical protein